MLFGVLNVSGWLLNVSGCDCWTSRVPFFERLGMIVEHLGPWLPNVLGHDCWTSRAVIAECLGPWLLNVSGNDCWKSRSVIAERLGPRLLNVSGQDCWKSRAVIAECLGPWLLNVSGSVCWTSQDDCWTSRAMIAERLGQWLLKGWRCDCWTSRAVLAERLGLRLLMRCVTGYQRPQETPLLSELIRRVRTVKFNNGIASKINETRRNNIYARVLVLTFPVHSEFPCIWTNANISHCSEWVFFC
jgi:hypothetical protein